MQPGPNVLSQYSFRAKIRGTWYVANIYSSQPPESKADTRGKHMVHTFGMEEPEPTAASTAAASERSSSTDGCVEMTPPVRYFRKRGKDVDGVQRKGSNDSTDCVSMEEKMVLRAIRNRTVGAELCRESCR